MLTSSPAWICPPALSCLSTKGVPQGSISWSSQPERSLPHGKLHVLGCVHKIPGVPPVYRHPAHHYLKCPDGKGQKYRLLERKFGITTLNKNAVKRKKWIPNTSISVTILLLIPVPALLYFYFRSTYILGTTEILRSGHSPASPTIRWRQFWVH